MGLNVSQYNPINYLNTNTINYFLPYSITSPKFSQNHELIYKCSMCEYTIHDEKSICDRCVLLVLEDIDDVLIDDIDNTIEKFDI